VLSVGLSFDAYAQENLSDRGYAIVEGRCGLEKIEYGVTNATLRSIEVPTAKIPAIAKSTLLHTTERLQLILSRELRQ
jgi:hypothetical protein